MAILFCAVHRRNWCTSKLLVTQKYKALYYIVYEHVNTLTEIKHLFFMIVNVTYIFVILRWIFRK